MGDHDVYLDTREAAELLKLSPVTLNQWRSHDCGPPYLRLGRAIRYRLADLRAWADAQRCATSSERPTCRPTSSAAA